MIDIAWRQLRPQLGQLAIAIVVIAFAVGLSAAMLLANSALRQSFNASTDAIAGRADLRIVAASGGLIDESILDVVRDVEGVDVAAPLLYRRLFLAGPSRAAVRLVGVDMLDDSTIRTYGHAEGADGVLGDPLLFLAQTDSVMAPAALMDRYGVRIGDSISLETPRGPLDLTVRARLGGGGVADAFGGSLLVMDLYSAQATLGLEGKLSQVDVRVAPGTDVSVAAEALERAIPDHYVAESLERVRQQLSSTFGGFQALLDGIAGLGLLLAALITGNRLSTMYETRSWEMGVVRALGTSYRQLVSDLLLEAAILSAIAVAIGLLLGVVLAQFIVHPVADATALSLKRALDLSVVPPAAVPLAIAGIAGVASGILAALIPAVRVARKPPALTLARSRGRDAVEVSSWKRAIRWAVTIAAGLLVLLQAFADVGSLGALTTVLVIAAAWLLVEPALGVVSQPLGELLGSAAALGVEDQGKVPSRAMGAAVVLMLGIAMVFWIGNMRESFATFVVDRLMATRRADLMVDSAFNQLATGDAQARLAPDVTAEIEKVPGVDRVGVSVVAKDQDSGFGILGVDPVRFLDKRFGEWALEGGADDRALADVAAGKAVIVDANLARETGLGVGDLVSFATPTGRFELRIAGVVRTVPVSQRGDIAMSRVLFQEAWQDATFTQAYVAIESGESAVDVKARIEERLGQRYQLRVLSTEELSGWFGDNVRQGFAFLDVLLVLTLAAALLGSFDALAANVVERTREIGTMRALGLTERDIAAMILSQALAIGVVGAGLGIIAGVAITYAFVDGVIPGTTGWRLDVYLRADVALVAIASGIGACIVGAVVPAIRAARILPATALRAD